MEEEIIKREKVVNRKRVRAPVPTYQLVVLVSEHLRI